MGVRRTQIRPVSITRQFTTNAAGSVLYASGNTRVLATACVEERVPGWLSGRGQGWVTAEYNMLPGQHRATGKPRARATGRIDGRTQEIQRLIGRAIRGIVDRKALGERTIWLDCDILQADGGTRTASVNAAYLALCDALRTHKFKKPLSQVAHHGAHRRDLRRASSAVTALADLDYHEDHRAEVDMNVVMTAGGGFLEVQGTGESRAFTGEELDALLARVRGSGIEQVLEIGRKALAEPLLVVNQLHGRLLLRRNHQRAQGRGDRSDPRSPRLARRGAERHCPTSWKTAQTFIENARLKARVRRRTPRRPSYSPRTADWSWIALGGAPGIHSARYARARMPPTPRTTPSSSSVSTALGVSRSRRRPSSPPSVSWMRRWQASSPKPKGACRG